MIEESAVETSQESSDESEKSLGDTLREAMASASSKDEPAPEAVEAVERPDVEVEQKPLHKAPESWTPASKAKFSELPVEIQQEIARREEDVHKGFTKFDEQRVFGKKVEETIAPYLPMIKAEGGSAIDAISGMLQTGYMLRNGSNESKVEAIKFLVNKYNIDLSPMIGQQGQMQGNYIDPTVQQLQQQVWEMQQAQQAQYQFAEQQEQAQIQSSIDSFASDPKNIYFENVKPEMAALLKEGRAADLQEAYDMACWARPDIRPLLLQSQQKQQAEQSREKVNKARSAAVSVTGSPIGSSGNTRPANRSLSEEIAANLRAAQGRI